MLISTEHIRNKKAKSMYFLKNTILTFDNIEFIQVVKVFFWVHSRCTVEKRKEKMVSQKKIICFSFPKIYDLFFQIWH